MAPTRPPSLAPVQYVSAELIWLSPQLCVVLVFSPHHETAYDILDRLKSAVNSNPFFCPYLAHSWCSFLRQLDNQSLYLLRTHVTIKSQAATVTGLLTRAKASKGALAAVAQGTLCSVLPL